MNTTSNYDGRLIDIELLKTIQEPTQASQAVHLSLTYQNQPRIVAGIEKLVQRYVLIFLTLVKSVKFDDQFGSIFMAAMTQGYLVNYGSLMDAFALSNSRVIATLINSSDNLPLDEQLSSASLIDFNLDFTLGTITLSIELTSLAGTSAEFVVPISIARV